MDYINEKQQEKNTEQNVFNIKQVFLKENIKTASLWQNNFKVWKSLQPIVKKCIKNSNFIL